MNYVYILICSDSSLYTGYTNNLDQRLLAHNSKNGAKYTKGRLPVRLVYFESFRTKIEALKREWEIKKMKRQEKINLIKKTGQFEKSCGAVVYKYQGQDILVLIEKMQKGHYSLPKGHSEGAESEVETALREIKEETNLDVLLDTDFRKVIYFSPSPNCLKEVVFFVGEALNDDLIKQEEEIEELFWVEFDSAVDLLTYENDQKVVLAAQKHLKNITKKEE